MVKFILYLGLCLLIMFVDFFFSLRGLLTLTLDIVISFFVILSSDDIKKSLKINKDAYLLYGVFSLVLLASLKEIISHYFVDYPINLYTQIDAFFIISIVVKSFTEEIIFRKFWFDFFLERHKVITSILIISLGFSFLHFFSRTNPIFAFVSSIVLCYIYFKKKSVMGTYIIHLTVNLFMIFALPSFLAYYTHVESWNKVKTIVIVGLLVICFLRFLFKKDKNI